MLKNIKNDFIVGLFTILPIGITLFVIAKVFNALDGILGKTLYTLMGRRIPGLGLLVTIIFIIIFGMLAKSVIGKQFTKRTDSIFSNFPILKVIYKPVKDILNNFSDKNSNNFKKAVLVDYPLKGCKSIGFITKENVEIGTESKTAIFIPTTPNPTSGFLVYLEKGMYDELELTVDEALKSIISLGSISPNQIKVKS